MPLFDYLCLDCGERSEILITNTDEQPKCRACGTKNVRKLLSAHSSLSGPSKHKLPGPGDTSCCGSSPDIAGCAGPGSCCRK